MLQGRRGCNTIPCSPTAAELIASTSECAVRETPNSSSVFNSSGRCLWPYGESLPMQCLTPTSLPIHGFVIPVRFQALFMVASFKEGFPGIAQSVTFVHFLRSALLYYFFLSKRPRNLIGEMRRWARAGRIIKKNCHFPGCSFVGPPAF